MKLRSGDIRQLSYSPPASLLAISRIKLGDIISLCSFGPTRSAGEDYVNAILPTFGCFCFEVGQVATKYFDNDQNENVTTAARLGFLLLAAGAVEFPGQWRHSLYHFAQRIFQ